MRWLDLERGDVLVADTVSCLVLSDPEAFASNALKKRVDARLDVLILETGRRAGLITLDANEELKEWTVLPHPHPRRNAEK